MLFKLKEKRAKLKEKRAKLKEQGVIASPTVQQLATSPTVQQLATNFNIMIAELQKLIFAGELNHTCRDLVNIENVFYTLVLLENRFVAAFNSNVIAVNGLTVADVFPRLYDALTNDVTISHIQNRLHQIGSWGSDLVTSMGSPQVPPVTQLPP